MNNSRFRLRKIFNRSGFPWILLLFLSPLQATGTESLLSYESYARVLENYVDDQGRVNYAGLQSDPSQLNEFLTELSLLPRPEYEDWARNDQIALWINAYNAHTLKAIIDHYPIRSSFLRSLAYPKNSIRQIDGVWDKLQFKVLGESMTLDHIEHQILRRRFGDPRIHMALVCAAYSCPPLRREPYQGSRLKDQFADQTRRFVGRANDFRLESGILHLSKIFDWFGEDFVARYAGRGKIGSHGTNESAVLQFLLPFLDAKNREAVLSGQFKIRYSDYDWTLNEQPVS